MFAPATGGFAGGDFTGASENANPAALNGSAVGHDSPELRLAGLPFAGASKAGLAALKADGDVEIPVRVPDAVDLAVSRLLSETAPPVEGWLASIEAMLDTADSLPEFQEMLRSAWPKLGQDKLTALLSDAFAAMRLRGISDTGEGG